MTDLSTHPTRPLVTVVIPIYNHRLYVEDAISSVLAQTYPHIELIVIDDCSPDKSWEIVAPLALEHCFQFVRNDRNLGLNATLEHGFSLSSGRYLSVLASDDVLLPDKISDQIDYLLRTGKDGVYGTCLTLSAVGEKELVDLSKLEAGFDDGSALQRIYTDSNYAPLFQSALIKRECLLGMWNERRKFKSDDWLVLIRLLENYNIGFVNQPQFLYRQHPNNTYRDYWGTMPMRMEIISLVTPEPLRPLGVSKVMRDQALFLYVDGKTSASFKFLLASMMLDPSLANWVRTIAQLSSRLARKLFR